MWRERTGEERVMGGGRDREKGREGGGTVECMPMCVQVTTHQQDDNQGN